mgnify:CR=1 FL=1
MFLFLIDTKKTEKVFKVSVAVKKKRQSSEKKRKNKNKRIFVDAYNWNEYLFFIFTDITNLRNINLIVLNSALFGFQSRFFTSYTLPKNRLICPKNVGA